MQEKKLLKLVSEMRGEQRVIILPGNPARSASDKSQTRLLVLTLITTSQTMTITLEMLVIS